MDGHIRIVDIERGTVAPDDALERCLARIERLEPALHAFACVGERVAREAARAASERHAAGKTLSALDGVPVAIKDIFDTRDLPTRYGSALFADHQPAADAACVAALRRAGAVVVGKTHTTEFAIGRSPPTRNPHDHARTPGGSSSGSAAAVAAGMVPIALGTQTAGSVLRPASYCGVVGYKPTHGQLPLGGVHPLSAQLDHVGCFASCVRDASTTVYAMWELAGGEAGDELDTQPTPSRPARLAWLRTDGWYGLGSADTAAFEALCTRLRELGVDLVDARHDADVATLEDALRGAGDLNLALIEAAFHSPYPDYLRRAPELLGPRIHALVEAAGRLRAPERRALARAQGDLRDAYAHCLRAAGLDGCITLAASGVAPVGLEYTGERTFLAPASVIGCPAFSLPLMQVDGLPLGLQVLGARGGDPALASIALWLEESLAPD